MKENSYQAGLIKRIKNMLPGCIVMKNDASYLQGVPDILVLSGDRWAALECKRSEGAPHRPNQDYYVQTMNEMSFAKFIHPDNEKEVLDGICQFFGTERKTRVP